MPNNLAVTPSDSSAPTLAPSPILELSPRLGRVLFALAIAATISYAALWHAAPILSSDSFGYMRLATDLRHLHISEFHQRTPGYPLLLLLTGSASSPTGALFYVSLIMHFASAFGLAALVRRLGVSRGLSVALLVVALLPPFVEPAAYVMPETITEFTLVFGYYCLIQWIESDRTRWGVAFGALAVLCALARPTFELWLPFIGVCLLALWSCGVLPRRVSRRVICVTTLSAAAVCGGIYFLIALTNFRHFGDFSTTSLTPYQLSTRTVGVVEYLPDRFGDLRSILLRHRDAYLIQHFDDHTAQNYIYRAYPDVVAFYGGDKVKALGAIRESSLYLILHKPASYVGEVLKAVASFWMPMDTPLANGNSDVLKGLWLIVTLSVFALFFLQLLVVGGPILLLVTWYLRFRSVAPFLQANSLLATAYLLGLCIISYNLIISCALGIGTARYRVPTDLLIMATTVMGVAMWQRSWVFCQPSVSAGDLGRKQ
jgi:hypothetical protein